MKVRVNITVEVDVEAWMLSYGVAKSEVREDVQSYIKSQVGDFAAAGEGLYEVKS